MSFYDSIKLIVNIILIMIFVVFIFWFLRQVRINKLDKRINSYTITKNQNRHSLFDIITNLFNNTRKRISKDLSKSTFLKNIL